MNGKKGLSGVMSALLAAMSFVGQASAADVKRPAGKVKVGKNVVRKERKKKAKSAELDVGGRERRGKAINAYASPLDNPRNLADAVLGVSTLGLGITAFYKHRKALEERSLKDVALKQQEDVVLFCSLGDKSEYVSGTLFLCCSGKDFDLDDLEDKLCGSNCAFYYANDGKVGTEVNKEEVVWSGDKFFCEFWGSGKFFVGPVARTLRDDINVFIDRCLLGIIVDQFEVDVATNKKGDHTIVDFRDHLMQSVGKKCEALRAGNKLADAEKLRERVDAVFRGADWVREYLYESLSKFNEEYNKRFESKKMELKFKE